MEKIDQVLDSLYNRVIDPIEAKKQLLKNLFDVIKQENINSPLLITSIEDMLFLINSIRETDQYIADIYLNGGCYQFHLMLKKFAPECEARITKEKNHIVTYFKGKYFDITGIVEGHFEPLNDYEIDIVSKWSFAKNNALQICECPVCGEPIVV
jgi:hypothetical protein